MREAGGSLSARLARLRAWIRLHLLVDGLAALAAASLVLAVVQFSLDRWLRLSLDQRATLALAVTTAWLWLGYRWLLTPLLTPLPDATLARTVGRLLPRQRELLAAAVQLANRGRPPQPSQASAGPANEPGNVLAQAVVAEAEVAARSLRFHDVLHHGRVRRRASGLAGVALAATMACLVWPDPASTWWRRNWLMHEIAWPQQTRLHPVGFDQHDTRRAPLGSPLRIEADIEGRTPGAAVLTWWTASGRRGRGEMAVIGGRRLMVELGPLAEDVSFRISGGDERTRVFRVIAAPRPGLTRTLARITPPAYTGLEAQTIEQQTVFEMLAGSELELEAWMNKPVSHARFMRGDQPAADVTRTAADHLAVRLISPGSGTYWFAVVDYDGWEDERPVRFTLKVNPDEPPTVRLRATDASGVVTPAARCNVVLEARDDYGLSTVNVSMQKNDEPPVQIPVSGMRPGTREFGADVTLTPARLRAAPGDRVRVVAHAIDQEPAGPNEGHAEPLEWAVVSPEEFLAAMAQREAELRREFERLVGAQRSLRDALLRESGTLATGRPPSGLAQRLSSLARRQEGHAGRVSQLSNQFGRILAELRTNQVLRRADEIRIRDRVMGPLERLGGERMRQAAAQMSLLGAEGGAEAVMEADGLQQEILAEMRQILANMLEWEGFREAVALLQEIIGQQESVRSETLSALEGELNAILGLEEPAESEPPPPP